MVFSLHVKLVSYGDILLSAQEKESIKIRSSDIIPIETFTIIIFQNK